MTPLSRNQPDKAFPDRVVITGVGTVTSLGCSPWKTALALRFRKSSWCEHETVLVADDPYGAALRGATVSRIPEELIHPGLDGAERAEAIFSPALNDCIAALSIAEQRRLVCRIDNFVEYEQHLFPSLLRRVFPGFTLEHGQQPIALGRCSFFERIIQAGSELLAGKAERILVGCVDSLCATSWLKSVRDEGILKDSMTPEGIVAGEAAGAVLLERETTARRRNATILAVLSSWGRGTEPNSWHGPIPSVGRGLTDAFREAFSSLGDGGKSIVTVIADLNGERHRALDWAYTEGRIFSDGEQEPELRHPAFIAGDCGGATGVLVLADAMGRFAFHPGVRGSIALTTSDESGARRVICLERSDLPERSRLMEQHSAKLAG